MIDTHVQILAIMGEEYRHCHILSGKKHKMKSEMVIFGQQNQRAGLNFEGGGGGGENTLCSCEAE